MKSATNTTALRTGRLLRLGRMPRRWALTLLALLGGSAAGCSCPAYGTPFTPPPHDPTVQLIDFSYSPPSPIHLGDSLTLTARLNHYAEGCELDARYGDPIVYLAPLYDDGYPPDATARDGVYTGMLVWTPQLGLGENMPVSLKLEWYDGTPGITRNTAPLTVED